MATSNSRKKPTTAELAEKHIISVNETRKILGKDSDGLSDDEVAELIFQLSVLGAELLKYKHFAK